MAPDRLGEDLSEPRWLLAEFAPPEGLGGTDCRNNTRLGRVTRAVFSLLDDQSEMLRAVRSIGEATEENIHVKIVSRALRVALAGGMVAGAFAMAAPSDSDAAVTTVGTCSGTRGLGSAKSTFIWPGDGKPAGITDKDPDASVSTKGTHAIGGAVGTIGGSCTFLQAVAFDKGLTKTPADTKSLLKWGAKTVSPTLDCVSDTDADEWPLSGKLSYSYDDALKTDAFVTTANPTGTPADVVNLVGIVTKGVGVGAQITSQVSYTPAIKDKLVVTDWDGTELVTEILLGGTPAERAVIQGYGVDPGALGCQAVAEPVTEATNIRYVVLGSTTPSPILGSTVGGTTMTIGAA